MSETTRERIWRDALETLAQYPIAYYDSIVLGRSLVDLKTVEGMRNIAGDALKEAPPRKARKR